MEKKNSKPMSEEAYKKYPHHLENQKEILDTLSLCNDYKTIAGKSIRLCNKIIYDWRISMIIDLILMLMWFVGGISLGKILFG